MKRHVITLAAALTIICSLCTVPLRAQEAGSLLDLVKDTTAETEYVNNAFKSTRVIMGQSIEMLGAGSLDFRILHRFGPITNGIDGLFGLDQSTMRFSFDYAPFNDLLVGFGRTTTDREYDGEIKYRVLHQSQGARFMPVSVVVVAGMMCETFPWLNTSRPNYFSSRLSYLWQAVIGSKVNEMFSVQVSPTVVHRNLPTVLIGNPDLSFHYPNDVYALGVGARVKITNRIAFTIDWFHTLNQLYPNGPAVYYDPLSIGFDIETGGHVFQVHVTNSNGMNERSFLTETTNNWAKGQIQLGFNISRMFQL